MNRFSQIVCGTVFLAVGSCTVRLESRVWLKLGGRKSRWTLAAKRDLT